MTGEPSGQLEEIVARALDELPRQFRDRISNLAIVIEDEPPEGRPWLGLYEGVPLPRRSVFQAWTWPSTITIYRAPLTRLFGHDPERFEREVTHVVHHELAHYFGISDERLIELGATEPARRGGSRRRGPGVESGPICSMVVGRPAGVGGVKGGSVSSDQRAARIVGWLFIGTFVF